MAENGSGCAIGAPDARLRAELAELEIAYRTAPIGLAQLDREMRFVRINEFLAKMNGFSIADHIGRTIREIVPAVADEAERLFRTVLETGEPIKDYELKGETPAQPGEERVWCEHWHPIANAGGEIVGVSVVVEDITERKQREAHIDFLMREMAHRAKNILAVVQSMSRQTARHCSTLDEFQERFGARLSALAASHDLLTAQDMKGCLVSDLIRAQMAPFGGADQVNLTGPRIVLDAAAAQHIGLALHELATNAAKYGALSVESGRVQVEWTMSPQPSSGMFRMVWRECGGPPPANHGKQGFGSAVIERLTPLALGGAGKLTLHPDGAEWVLTMPASHLLSE